jgi:hypothetical protein
LKLQGLPCLSALESISHITIGVYRQPIFIAYFARRADFVILGDASLTGNAYFAGHAYFVILGDASLTGNAYFAGRADFVILGDASLTGNAYFAGHAYFVILGDLARLCTSRT